MKQKWREKPSLSTAPMPAATDAPLSPQWAFVVQFRVHADGKTVYTTGRVEHLVSGRMTRFESLNELVVYFEQELRQRTLSSST
jgi:hypothetical protein